MWINGNLIKTCRQWISPLPPTVLHENNSNQIRPDCAGAPFNSNESQLCDSDCRCPQSADEGMSRRERSGVKSEGAEREKAGETWIRAAHVTKASGEELAILRAVFNPHTGDLGLAGGGLHLQSPVPHLCH